MRRKSERELLRQQMELLIEESKNCMPGELSQNSQAVAKTRSYLSTVVPVLYCLASWVIS